MSDNVSRALEGDAPPTATVHQHDLAKREAESRSWHEAALIGRTVTVNLPRAEVYAFWRDFRNLARFMENIDSIEVGDDRRSHWRVKAPAGRTVEWDSILTIEEEGRLLAWETAEGSDIKHAGTVEFRDAPPGRGTEVTATIAYEPPAGEAGVLLARLFQREPKVQTRRDLRRFKQLMETGEISTSRAPDAAPRG